MIVNSEMKIKDVLKQSDQMLDALVGLAPEFKRLRNSTLRKLMAGRVNVGQAARIAKLPLNEVLYSLNLAAGEDEQTLSDELQYLNEDGWRFTPENSDERPIEIDGLKDNDPRVHFVDVLPYSDKNSDPRPAIMHGLSELRDYEDVLLLRHRYDPIPLRDLFKLSGFESWAEERNPREWYIYFYRPGVHIGAAIHIPMSLASYFHSESTCF